MDAVTLAAANAAAAKRYPYFVTAPRKGKPQRILTGFQPGHGWVSGGGWGTIDLNNGSALGTDQTTYKLGQGKSVYAVTNGTGAGNFLASPTLAAFDATQYATIGVWVYVTAGVVNLNTLSFYLGSDTAYANSKVITADTPNQLPTNEWTLVPFSLASATVAAGTPAMTSIVACRIRMADTAAGTVSLRFGGVILNPTPTVLNQGCISFCQDDSYLSGYQTLAPMLAAYGYPATAFTITDLIDTGGSRVSTQQLRELHDDYGWSVSSHSYTLADHAAGFANLSAAQLDVNFRSQREWLRRNAFTRGADITAYPLSSYNDAVRAATKRYFAAAYTTSNFPRSTLPHTGDRTISRRLMLDATTTTTAVQAEIDKARTGPYHLVIGMHDIVSTGASGSAVLASTVQTIVNYVASSGATVRTIDDVLRTEP